MRAELKSFPDIVLAAYPKAVFVHGSRDYFNIFVNGIKVELSQYCSLMTLLPALNSMDLVTSMLIMLNARINDAQRADVLLLKQFCRACGVYGR
jgi:hypothetical protein